MASLPRLLLGFSPPAIVGLLVTALYNIVDSIFVGRGGGHGPILPDFCLHPPPNHPAPYLWPRRGLVVGPPVRTRAFILTGIWLALEIKKLNKTRPTPPRKKGA